MPFEYLLLNMSQDLNVYALDLAGYRSIRGSCNIKLLRSILKSKWIRRHDDYFRGLLNTQHYESVATAIRQIVDNRIDSDLIPKFQFEHAAVIIARELGSRLASDCFLETKAEFAVGIDSALDELRKLVQVAATDWPTIGSVLERGPALDIPLDARMRLGTGFIEADEAARAARICSSIDLPSAFMSPHLRRFNAFLAPIAQYRDWIVAATQRGVGLYMFR